MFWFKPKKIYVDCFTAFERVYDQYAPEKAANFIPNWWKKLPECFETSVKYTETNSYIKPISTMRNCTGFKDLYFNGLIIPLWSDLKLDIYENNYHYLFADNISRGVEHSPIQYGNSYHNFHHIKLLSPWLLKEQTGVKFIFTEPTWSFLNFPFGLRILPGVMQYDLHSETNINMFIPKPKSEEHILIEAGHPMCHLIPLTDKKLVIKKHLVSEREAVGISNRMRPVKFLKDFEVYRAYMKGKK